MAIPLEFHRGISGFWGEMQSIRPYQQPLPPPGLQEVRLCIPLSGEEDVHDPTASSSSVAPTPVKLPELPSLAEQEAHALAHLPPAPWCSECMASRSRDDPHRDRQEEHPGGIEEELPVIQLDHTFVESLVVLSL